MNDAPSPSSPRIASPESASGGAATAAPPHDETWNLDDLFASNAAFAEARRAAVARIEAIPECRGRLGQSAEELAEALDRANEAARHVNRLHAFTSMRSDTDTRIAEHHAARQEVELLWNDLSKATAFLRPEILEIPPATLRAFLSEGEPLAPHRHFLEDLDRRRDHVLSPAEEDILAQAGLVTGSPSTVFGVFHNAELPRPTVTLSDGASVELGPAAFSRHRTTPVRDDRDLLFRRYFGAYAPFRETFGASLYGCVRSHVFRARARRYGSCLEASLDGDNVPVAVYENLVTQVRKHLPILFRYFGLRARALGLPRVEYHDLHCALGQDPDRTYSTDAARGAVRDSLEPLGPTYATSLDRCFEDRWIDWHPTPGKRSGAYASGAAYDVHPYILLNFNRDYESVSTLAHEVGHAIHSDFSNRAQPYATADYSIFVAEVASTFNEALLNAHMQERATTDEERLVLVSSWLDQMRATLFRQTMFAEFEAEIHARAEGGQALTGESLSAMYLALLRDYHGHADGVLEIPERYDIEWAGVPHFYYDFYVYQYATGIVASTALSDAVLGERPGAREDYLAFLSSGGSDDPLELLRHAGVDLETPEPYERTMEAIARNLDRLEALLDRLGR